MGYESTATYIDELVPGNPATGDNPGLGDDHLRLIKAVLQASFPYISGAVAASDVELSYVDGVTSAIQTQLNQRKPTWTTVSTTPYSAADGGWYLVRTNSAACQINLPAGTTGFIVRIKDADGNAGTNNISVNPDGTEQIEDIAAGDMLVIDYDYGSVTLQYLNSAWRII